MKIFLDDVRDAPDETWTVARNYRDAEALVCHLGLDQEDGITEISLDHDLGDDGRGTGYDVILWIEAAVAQGDYIPPSILIHTANAPARKRMEAGATSISRLLESRRHHE